MTSKGSLFWDTLYLALEAVQMSRASPANRADSILSRPMVAKKLSRTKIKRHSRLTANLGQVFLFQVSYLIAIFLFTFAILKKLVANLLRNIANLLSQLKTPHFLLEVPHFLLEVHVTITMHVSVAVPDKITYTLVSFTVKHYYCI